MDWKCGLSSKILFLFFLIFNKYFGTEFVVNNLINSEDFNFIKTKIQEYFLLEYSFNFILKPYDNFNKLNIVSSTDTTKKILFNSNYFLRVLISKFVLFYSDSLTKILCAEQPNKIRFQDNDC